MAPMLMFWAPKGRIGLQFKNCDFDYSKKPKV